MSRALGRASKLIKTDRLEWLERVDVLDFLERLDIDNISQARVDELQFSCPFGGHSSGDSTPSAYMNTGEKNKAKTTAFKCHGCGRQGNAINFYAEYAGVSKTEATSHVRQQYAAGWKPPKGGSISAEFEQRRLQIDGNDPEAAELNAAPSWGEYEERFGVDWGEARKRYEKDDECPMPIAYLFDRGFDKSNLKQWKIGYDNLSSRLTIPVADDQGRLVGIKGRTWKTKLKPKYKVLGDKEGRRPRYGFMPYEKSRVVFGLYYFRYVDDIVLVEGELDVLALDQISIPAISTGSAHLSETQARLIRDHFNTVIVFFDSNTAGDNATFGYYSKDGEWNRGIVEKLEPFMSVRIVDEHQSDAADMVKERRLDELNGLITGAISSKQLLRE